MTGSARFLSLTAASESAATACSGRDPSPGGRRAAWRDGGLVQLAARCERVDAQPGRHGPRHQRVAREERIDLGAAVLCDEREDTLGQDARRDRRAIQRQLAVAVGVVEVPLVARQTREPNGLQRLVLRSRASPRGILSATAVSPRSSAASIATRSPHGVSSRLSGRSLAGASAADPTLPGPFSSMSVARRSAASTGSFFSRSSVPASARSMAPASTRCRPPPRARRPRRGRPRRGRRWP